MKEDKAFIIRKTFIVITLILIFATVGLLLVSFQIKTVTLNYFGSQKNIKTLSTTVQSFLLQNKINVTDDMIVSPSLDSKLSNNMEIRIYSEQQLSKIDINKITEGYAPTVAKIVEVVDPIPFEEQKVDNAAINRGATKVTQEGKEGQKVTRYLVKYNGQEEIYKAELDSKVTAEPQNKVIEVGTKLSMTTSRSSSLIIPSDIVTDAGFKQYNIKLPVEQQKYAYNMAQKYGIQYELFLAMMYKESGYNPNAVGGGNSYGLCQIHISNHAKLRNILGVSNFFDPYDNITAGAYMLYLYFGSARNISSDPATVEIYALNSYNMGEGAYYSICFSKGVVDRSYSTSIRNLRNTLINNGGL